MIIKRMKRVLLCLAGAAVAMSGAGAYAAATPEIKLEAPAPPKVENKISSNTVIMKINGEEIKEGQLDEIVDAMLNEYLGQFGGMIQASSLPPEIRESARTQGLKRLKEQTLMEQAVKSYKFEPTEAQIQDEWKTMETRLKIAMGDEATFKDQIAKAVAQSKEKDVTPEFITKKLKDQFKSQLQLMAVVEKESGGNVSPTADEVKTIFEKDPSHWGKVRASHILIEIKPSRGTATTMDQEARKKAQDVLKEARESKDFGALAKKYSEDKGSAEQGGDLGYFYFEKMEPTFSKAAFSMKAGQISDLVQSQYGFHIIKVVDVQPVKLDDPKNTVDTRRRIVLAERNGKLPILYPQAVMSLAKKAKIEDLMPAAAKPDSDIKITPITPQAAPKAEQKPAAKK